MNDDDKRIFPDWDLDTPEGNSSLTAILFICFCLGMVAVVLSGIFV